MGRGKAVNWKNLFIAGLILGLSPFYIRLDHSVFIYSLLGYGLCALSYLFKRRVSVLDYLIVMDLVLLFFAGFFNYFKLYVFFQYLFLALLFTSFTDTEKGLPARLLSFPMIFFSGALFTLYFGGLFGVRGLFDIANFLFYLSYFMAGAAVFVYREPA